MFERYGSVREVFEAVEQIRNELIAQGQHRAAERLTVQLEAVYTTGSEALDEILTALAEIRPVWEQTLGGWYRELVLHAVKEATRLYQAQPDNEA